MKRQHSLFSFFALFLSAQPNSSNDVYLDLSGDHGNLIDIVEEISSWDGNQNSLL